MGELVAEFRLAVSAAMLLAALTSPASAHKFEVFGLEIVHPWARPTVAVQKNGAVYVTIRNHGSGDDRLVGATTPEAERVEIHDSSVSADGVARMQPKEGVPVPAGGEAVLAPGGLHLMLVNLRNRQFEGTSFPMTLQFARGREIAVEVMVESNSSAGEEPPGHATH